MNISLLHIILPTILVLAVLIIYMNSCSKRILKEIGELRAQLERPAGVSDTSAVREDLAEEIPLAEEKSPAEEQVKEQDAPEPVTEEQDASEYNTGKSGKIYTKEELEILIKE